MKTITVKNQFPLKLKFLFEPATAEKGRYKVVYGGRNGIKSWSIARCLLQRGIKKTRRNPLLPGETENSPISFRIWCAREVQNSLEESVYHLLVSQIKKMGLGMFYDVQKNKVVGKKGTTAEGTEFMFFGLHDVEQRKSMEDIDIVWFEEANKVTKHSWETVIPTIRKEYADGTCSEIIVSFNPDMEDDEAYQRFVVLTKRPPNAIVVETSYKDNIWLSKVSLAEIELLKKQDFDAYLTVYEGKTRQVLEGAVFAKELRAARSAGRICEFEPERGIPVNTFWDLGKRDHTAIWFIQRVGLQWRVVDFYQNRLEDLEHYVGILEAKRYIYRTHFLPHDGKATKLGQRRSVEQQLRGGDDPDVRDQVRDVRVLPVTRLHDQHNALKSLFPNLWFAKNRVNEGLAMLAKYAYEIDPKTKQFSNTPLHDDNSHCASALMQFAISATDYEKKRKRPVDTAAEHVPPMIAQNPQGWLAS